MVFIIDLRQERYRRLRGIGRAEEGLHNFPSLPIGGPTVLSMVAGYNPAWDEPAYIG